MALPARFRFVSSVLFLACAGADPRDAADGDGPPRFSDARGDVEAPAGASPGTPAAAGEGGSANPGTSPNSNEGSPSISGRVEPTAVPAGGAAAQSEGQEEPGETTALAPPAPSMSSGCGQAAPPTGQLSISVGGVDAAYTVTLPPNYDPTLAYPLVFGFHGRGRTHLEFQQVDASGIQTELGERAIMAYLKSQVGNGWNSPEEVEPNVAFFEALYPQMLQRYCVDVSKVYAVGHSSGGYFSNILGCRFADRLRGIASIAGASQESGCEGRVAALLIHGVRDSVVSFASGVAQRDGYVARNGCGMMVNDSTVTPCVAYLGCAQGFPVQWCEHEEPTYENTNHGWPSFASRAVGEFLFSLP